ncbi:MAG: carbon-nitrogen hydrolase family protein [Pseudomonas sp.]
MHTLIRRSLRLLFPALLLGLLLAYVAWTQSRPHSHYLSDLRSEVGLNLGTPSGKGNLLGIQPALYNVDYRSVGSLQRKLSAYLDKAHSEGLLNPRTVVILPEHIGTWLVAAGEKPQVFAARQIDQAMLWLALSHPLDLTAALLTGQGPQRLNDALFRMKAKQMARDYQQLFGGLAKRYGVTLVAGSILLPDPQVRDGVLQVGSGPLYNASQVFAADGSALGQPQRKVYPIPDEAGFTAAAPDTALHVVTTPAGRLGVLICADSWYPAGYQQLASQQVDLLAVPAFLTGNQHWSQPWGGYTTFAGTPTDVTSQPGQLSEGEAWQRHSLPTRLASTQAHAGMTVFMRGQLWDLGSDGHSMAVGAGGLTLASEAPGGQLINLWL